MKFKDYEPIKFEFFQSDIERLQFFLQESVIILGQVRPDIASGLAHFKAGLDQKIVVHRDRGDWV